MNRMLPLDGGREQDRAPRQDGRDPGRLLGNAGLSALVRVPRAGTWLSRPRAGGPWRWLRRPCSPIARWWRSSTRTATSAWTAPSARRRASGSRRSRCSDPAGAAGASEIRRAANGRPEALPRRRQGPSGQSRLRPGHAAHGLPEVRCRRLGTGAGGLQQHRRRRAGRAHGRRQDLQGARRRPFPRRVVVLHGAGGPEAIAQRVDRFRGRQAAPRRLQDAQPAQRQRRSDLPPRGPLHADRLATTSRRRRSTSCAW